MLQTTNRSGCQHERDEAFSTEPQLWVMEIKQAGQGFSTKKCFLKCSLYLCTSDQIQLQRQPTLQQREESNSALFADALC